MLLQVTHCPSPCRAPCSPKCKRRNNPNLSILLRRSWTVESKAKPAQTVPPLLTRLILDTQPLPSNPYKPIHPCRTTMVPTCDIRHRQRVPWAFPCLCQMDILPAHKLKIHTHLSNPQLNRPLNNPAEGHQMKTAHQKHSHAQLAVRALPVEATWLVTVRW